uniref:Acyl-CoA dehydrogenase/oxidase C-terminal domain-containing protein n=1 Tax=Plectus sambesii TaxID=2011161 RepID=A0A914WCQ2_9BILA
MGDGNPGARIRDCNIAFCGKVESGKSSMINALRHVKKGEPDWTPVSSFQSTADVKPYRFADRSFKYLSKCDKELRSLADENGDKLVSEKVKKTFFDEHELTAYCNKTFQFERTLAENSGIKKRLSDLCLNAYVLETMSYYIAGLRDEEWIDSTDLENAIIHRYANRFLRDALLGAMEIVGSASATTEFDFERLIRDAMTLTALSTSDTLLTDQIAMDAITAWAEKYDVHLSEVRQPNENWWRTMRNRVRVGETLDKPKMRHYIAEHAHPSLEFACRNLEDTMGRVGAVMELLLERRGKAVEADHVVLENIADVVASNFAMLALISRSSRSYAIGLRNSDVEMRWATMFCLHAGFLAKKKLEEIMDVVNMTRYVPALTEIGATALNMEGYKLESPLERNW